MSIALRLLGALLLCWWSTAATGQNCGCAEAGNCPATVSAGGSQTVCYDFTDALNDDLTDPAQGICGVRVRFRHNSVNNLSITLTNPDGTDAVTLVGPGTADVNVTTFSIFDLTFVPCAPDGVPVPDVFPGCALPDTWSNEIGNDGTCPAWPNGLFDGSYFPNAGCLQDFDQGGVNGTWCLTVDNQLAAAANYTAEILDFELILCDNTGIFCCDADAGTLPVLDPLRACENTDTLLLAPDPQWTVRPDSTLYGYTYLIADGDNIVALDSTADLRAFTPGTYTVCGLNYARDEAAALPAVGSSLAAVQADLYSPNPSYCAQLTADCRTVIIGSPPPPLDLTRTVCTGDTVIVGGQVFDQSGLYPVDLTDQNGCDSLVRLDLTVLLADTVDLTPTICAGDCFAVGDSCYTSPGQYEYLLAGSRCDSLVRTELTVVTTLTTDLTESICAGTDFAVGDSLYTLPGNYSNLLTSSSGCDSTVNLTLSVIAPQATIADPDTLTCGRSSVMLDGSASTGTDFYWSTNGGSIVGPATGDPIAVDAPGTYQLRVTDGSCADSTTVTVVEVADLPVVSIAPPDTLDCLTVTLTLDATASAGGSNFAYQWTTADGCLLPGTETSAQPGVTCGGTYRLEVRNLSTACTDTASVFVVQDIAPPQAALTGDTLLTCTDPTTQLVAGASAGSGSLSYAWRAPGDPAFGGNGMQSPIIDAAGTYELVVLDNQNFCRDSLTQVVTVDDALPMALIAPTDTLTCARTTVSLDGGASSSGPGFSYQWMPTPAAGQGTPLATADAPGLYVLRVTDTGSGCVATDSVLVVSDIDLPTAEAGSAGLELSCLIQQVQLGSNTTSTGGAIEYAWRDPTGDLVGAGLFYNAVAANTYYLTVTNTVNGCTATDSVTVGGNYVTPIADAGSAATLTCDQATVLLDGGGSSVASGPLAFRWETSGGSFVADTDTTTVGSADTYILIVTQLLSGCNDTAAITIVEDSNLPLVDAGPDQLLDCLTGTAQLDGSASAQGPNLVYSWTPTASIVDATLPLQPVVDAAGIYTLVVLDTVNNCSAADQVSVGLDPACAPAVDAGADGTVNCYSDCDTLDATATFVGPFTQYSWTALSGTIKAGDTTLTPVVTEGEYLLAVTNTQLNQTVFDTVAVLPDYLPPVADAGPDTLIGCAQLSACFGLSADGSAQGPDYRYAWVTFGGNFCTDTTLLNPQIDRPGLYELTVTDLRNGCAATDVVVVSANPEFPVADAGPDTPVACGDTTAVLDGSGSSIGPEYTYTWTASGGTLLANADTPNPTVQVPDGAVATFYLEVLNTQSTCASLDSVLVVGAGNCQPLCEVLPPNAISCDSTRVILDGSGSSTGPDFAYFWSTADGQLCPGSTDQAVAYACAPGSYELRVVDVVNGIECSKTVLVPNATTPPVIAAPQALVFACADGADIALDGSGSAQGGSIIYDWSGPCVVGGADSLVARAACDGLYTFTVRDTTTGCVATRTTQVVYDTLGPVIDAGPALLIDCADVQLAGGGPGNPGETVLWKTTDGVIATGGTTYTPIISAAGTYYLCVTDAANGCMSTDSVLVTPTPDALDCDAGPDLALTCADSTFEVTATVTNATAPGYAWSTTDGCIDGPTDDISVRLVCAGTYRLTVVDAATGCSCTSELTVTDIRSYPQVEAGPDQTLGCDDTTVTLDGSGSSGGAVFYFWDTPNGGPITAANEAVATASAAGTYRLTVTDQASGCSRSDTLRVTLDDAVPLADAGPDALLTCTTVSVLLDGSGSSGGPTIDYNWSTPNGNISGPNTNVTATATAAGTYILGVTDQSNGCAQFDTVLVALDEAVPTAAIGSVTTTLDCNNPNLLLMASSNLPVDSVTFDWFLLANNAALPLATDTDQYTADQAGSYLLEATSLLTGCTDTAQLVLTYDGTVPVVLIDAPDTLTCARDTVGLRAQVSPPGDYTYTWLDAADNALPHGDTTSYGAISAGLFILEISNNANGCPARDSVTVIGNLTPPAARATVSGALDCVTPAVFLDGSGSTPAPLDYRWRSVQGDSLANNGQSVATAFRPGDYVLTVTRADNGCRDSTTVTVTADEVPLLGLLMTVRPPTCFGDSDGQIRVDSVIGGTPPYLYALDGASFSPLRSYTDLAAGSYRVRVQDANGCDWIETVTLDAPNELLASLSAPVELFRGDSTEIRLQLNVDTGRVASLQWTPGVCPDCFQFMATPLQTTRYEVLVRDTAGCTARASTFIYVLDELPLYVPTAFSPNFDNQNDLFYPQAGPGIVRISAFRIFDRWGELVHERTNFLPNDPRGGWDGHLDGRPLDPGVFVWQLELLLVDGRTASRHGEVTLLR